MQFDLKKMLPDPFGLHHMLYIFAFYGTFL